MLNANASYALVAWEDIVGCCKACNNGHMVTLGLACYGYTQGYQC